MTVALELEDKPGSGTRVGTSEKFQGQEAFIVDDVLICFDDERTEAALEVFAELSSKTQVVYFTHHERILDLAQKVAVTHPGRVFCQRLGSQLSGPKR